MICALADKDCVGRLEFHHVVKQQRLKREFKYGADVDLTGAPRRWQPALRTDPVTTLDPFTRTLDDILGDTRNRVWLCSAHHERVTNGRVQPPVPESVWAFAKDFGLTGALENDLARRSAA